MPPPLPASGPFTGPFCCGVINTRAVLPSAPGWGMERGCGGVEGHALVIRTGKLAPISRVGPVSVGALQHWAWDKPVLKPGPQQHFRRPMNRYRRALERIKAFPDGLMTPIPAWQVVEQMAAIADEALGGKHVEFPPLRRECRGDSDAP